MPQMAPLNWLPLLIMFIMIYIMFNYMNFFMFLYSPKKEKTPETSQKKNNWKW